MENNNYNKNKGQYTYVILILAGAAFTTIGLTLSILQWNTEDIDHFGAIIFNIISISFLLIGIIAQAKLSIKNHKEKKLYENGFHTKGKLVDVMISETTSLSYDNYNSYSLYFIKIEYIDENGITRIYKPSIKYSQEEINYLIYKKEFDIICKGRRCDITENMELAHKVDSNLVAQFVDENAPKIFNPKKIVKTAFPYFQICSLVIGLLAFMGITFPITISLLLDSNIMVQIIAIGILSFVSFSLIIKLLRYINICRVYSKGKEEYALSFKLKIREPIEGIDSPNNKLIIYLTFVYLDYHDYEHEETILINESEYEKYNSLEKLPIKVYMSEATIDYSRLSN